MARYTCNYVAPSTSGLTSYTGAFVGTFQCSSNSTSGCFACICSSCTYRSDNFVTLMCCSNWCYTSTTSCFLQNMACFDEVKFSVAFCTCCSVGETWCLGVLNCRCAVHTHTTNPVFVLLTSGLTPGACCYNYLCNFTCGRSSISISFFPGYNLCASCSSSPSLVYYNLEQLATICTIVIHSGVPRSGFIQPCQDSPSAGWLDWGTFNGLYLQTGNMASGTGCYSLRARIRCS